MALGFAATATGRIRALEWRKRVRIDDKLSFSRPLFGFSVDKVDGKEVFRCVQLGVRFENLADCPIEFKMEYMYCELGQRFRKSKKWVKTLLKSRR